MTLALTVVNPMLLYAGTALASIPIIIHLLNRLRFKRVVWAAMEFLLAAHRKNARRVKIEHLILLILRTLIILLLAAAIARPILEGFMGMLGSSSVHRIIVIDDSYSMSAQTGVSGEKTAMKQAIESALALMDTFKKSDGLSLVTVGSQPHARIGGVSYKHEDVRAMIERMQPSDSATDMVAAMDAVRRIVNESTHEQKVVYILTDNTAEAWRDDSGKTLRTLAAGIAEQADIVVVDFGSDDEPNLALTAFTPDRAVVTEDVLSYFTLKVHNYGATSAENVVANLTVDNSSARPVSFGRVDAGKTVVRKWTFRFDSPGNYQVEARLKDMPGNVGDAVIVDSRRRLSLSIKKSLNVLLVDGEPGATAPDNETFQLQVALDPRTRDQDRETIFSPTWIRDSELDSAAMEGQDVVVMANVGSLNGEQQRSLRSFVHDGGSLVIFLGDQVQLGSYNTQLYEDGKGLLPAFIVEAKGTTEPGHEDQYTTFDPGYFDHPILSEFRNAGSTGGLDMVRVKKYYQLKPPSDDANTKVVLKFRNGYPGVVEKQVDRGKVVLVATTADGEWTNLMAMPGGPQLLHEMMDYLTPNVLWRFNCLVDGDTSIPVPTALGQKAVSVTPPEHGEQVVLMPEILPDNRFVLNIDELSRSGFYSLEGGGLTGRTVAVNVDPREARLDHLDEAQLREQLGGATLVYAAGQAGLTRALEAQASAGGWARNFLYAMLCLVLVETVLAWYFNRGV